MLYVVVIEQTWMEPIEGGAVDAYLVTQWEASAIEFLLTWLRGNVRDDEELGCTIPHIKIIGVVETSFTKDDDPITVKMELFSDAVTRIYTDSRYEEDPEFYNGETWPITIQTVQGKQITTFIQDSKEDDGGTAKSD